MNVFLLTWEEIDSSVLSRLCLHSAVSLERNGKKLSLKLKEQKLFMFSMYKQREGIRMEYMNMYVSKKFSRVKCYFT